MDPYYKSEEFHDVLDRYEAITRGEDGFLDAADYADVAEFFLAQGDDKRAKEAAQIGVSVFPDALPPLALLARIEMSQGHTDRARQVIQQAEDKDELEYHYVIAELMIAEGRTLDADRYLEALESDDDPDDIALDICAIFIDHNEFQLARKWLNRVKDRSKPDVQDFEAHILTGEGNFDEGEKKVNELLDDDPYSTEHWNHLAAVQYQRADYPASIESSNFTLAIDAHNAEALLNKANALYALKNHAEALRYYDQFLNLRPDNITATYYKGVALSILHRHDEAISTLERALALALQATRDNGGTAHEFLTDIVHELAFELSETKQLERAQQALDKVLHELALNPENAEQRADLYLCKAKLCFLQADADEAVECFDKARRTYDEPETYVRMTAVIFECGFPERAYDVLGAQLFSEEGRKWNTGHAYLARYAFELGLTDVYDALLPIALERNPIEAQMLLYDLYPAGTRPEDYPKLTPNLTTEES